MTPQTLSELLLLSSARFDSQPLLCIVLAGDARLIEKLRHDELVSLGSRIRTRLTTEFASCQELLACLDHLLADASNASLMTPQLRHTLCDHAAGKKLDHCESAGCADRLSRDEYCLLRSKKDNCSRYIAWFGQTPKPFGNRIHGEHASEQLIVFDRGINVQGAILDACVRYRAERDGIDGDRMFSVLFSKRFSEPGDRGLGVVVAFDHDVWPNSKHELERRRVVEDHHGIHCRQ